MTYTYDPTKISENGKDRMRFELGDTAVDGGAETCALSDEEYTAIANGITGDTDRHWKLGKLAALEAILFKFSYQVDTKIDVLSYSFSDRAERWKQLYDDLKKSVASTASVPTMDGGAAKRPPYFFLGMGNNPEARPRPAPPGWRKP